jgi:hypothetical protein
VRRTICSFDGEDVVADGTDNDGQRLCGGAEQGELRGVLMVQPVAHHHHLRGGRHVGEAGKAMGGLRRVRSRSPSRTETLLPVISVSEEVSTPGAVSVAGVRAVKFEARGDEAGEQVERRGGGALHAAVGGVRGDGELLLFA